MARTQNPFSPAHDHLVHVTGVRNNESASTPYVEDMPLAPNTESCHCNETNRIVRSHAKVDVLDSTIILHLDEWHHEAWIA